MKILHLFLVILIVISLSTVEFNSIFAQTQHGSVATLQLSTSKLNFEDGEIIPIQGYSLVNLTTNIFLADNYGNIENFTQVRSNSTGYFYTSLGIPSHVAGGAWALFAKSGESSFATQIMVNAQGVNPPPFNFPSGLAPLKQFKLGIESHYVQCRTDLQLIIKIEDDSPACVQQETISKLVERGWVKEVSPTSFYTIPTISSAPCDMPYPRSNVGVAVLYMPTNSTGKICATYHNPDSPTQSSVRVFAAKDVQQMASEITTSAHPDIVPTGNSTIVYDIKTGRHAGLYGMSFFCGSIPFAVGYDNQSRIILDDFPWLYKNDICLSQINVFQITGLSGIHIKYVTVVHRG